MKQRDAHGTPSPSLRTPPCAKHTLMQHHNTRLIGEAGLGLRLTMAPSRCARPLICSGVIHVELVSEKAMRRLFAQGDHVKMFGKLLGCDEGSPAHDYR